MYYKSRIPDRKWRQFSPVRTDRLAHAPKKFLASEFASALCGPLNMRSSVSPTGLARKIPLGP